MLTLVVLSLILDLSTLNQALSENSEKRPLEGVFCFKRAVVFLPCKSPEKRYKLSAWFWVSWVGFRAKNGAQGVREGFKDSFEELTGLFNISPITRLTFCLHTGKKNPKSAASLTWDQWS